MSTYEARLAALREQLKADRLDGFVVPLTDEHMSEYVGSYAQRLAWLTGFQGSAGSAVVLPEEAAIFVDGRYTLQVRDQVDGNHWSYQSVPETSIADWLKVHAPDGGRIGYDPWLHTKDWVTKAREALAEKGAELVAVRRNPIDAVWADQPEPSRARLIVHPDDYAGQILRRQAPGDGGLAEGAEGRCGGARGAGFDRLDVQRPRQGRRAYAGRALLRARPRRRHRGPVRRLGEDRRRCPPASRQRRPRPRAQRFRARARQPRRQDRGGRSRAIGGGDLRRAGESRRAYRLEARPLDPAQGDQERGRDQGPPGRAGARRRRFVALPPLALGRGAEGRARRAQGGGQAAGLPPGRRRPQGPQLRHHIGRRPQRRHRPLQGQRGDQPADRDGFDLPRRSAAANIRTAPPTSPGPW